MKDINIDLTCPNCQYQFSLDPNEILEKEMLWCPQCQCTLSEEELKDLKTAIKYMTERN
jgi:Zn-finger nucleic acid-binding protein